MTLLLALWLGLSVPDPAITPGALCSPASGYYDGSPHGFPHCQRHVTVAIKKLVLSRYHIPWKERGLYEVDHLVPLCMGGSNDVANLWPESWPNAKRKDVLENRLCRQLAAGAITQDAAIAAMRQWH